MWKEMVTAYVKVLSQNYLRGTEENNENVRLADSWSTVPKTTLCPTICPPAFQFFSNFIVVRPKLRRKLAIH
jgi:hypothetical protein